jgi:hypothetical protein
MFRPLTCLVEWRVMRVDDQITKPKNLLAAALDTEGGDAAATVVRDALGIADYDVANYSLPLEWPHDRDQRANALREWPSNELRYLL